MDKRLKIYVGGGWFSKNQDEVLSMLEGMLTADERVKAFLPRHDGVKLSENEFHDASLRESIFLDNVKHIDESELVVAACDGRDGFYDTGTQWEIGYAMAKGIPVIAYDTTKNIYMNMQSIFRGFHSVCHTKDELRRSLEEFIYKKNVNIYPKKILFVGPDSTDEQQEANADLISSVVLECHGSNFRWIDDLSMDCIHESIDDIFSDVDCMISVIDDRHPIVSWLMGQAYSRDIPTITYTNFDYGVNIMLLCSIIYHCKGKEELRDTLQKIKREGINSLPKFDNSTMKAM